MSYIRIVGALTRRALLICVKQPSLIASSLLMNVFFLVVYDGQLSAVGDLLTGGGRYVAVVLPLFLLTTAFTGGSVAGQLIVRDIESGYHARLTVTPVPRSALILAPVLAGSIALAGQALALLAVASLLGLRPDRGVPAWLALIAATVTVGVGFLLLATAAAVYARSNAAVNAVTLVFFPLSFLTATLVPRDQLGGWMAVAADINPLTYPLQAMRTMLTVDWSGAALARGAVAAAVLLIAGVTAVLLAIARQTRTGV